MITYILTLIKKTKGVTIFTDLSEMENRIRETYKALHASCKTSKGEKLVSVVIPTRNERTRITTLLKSLNTLCYRPIEVIVADYESTDGTPEIAKKLGAKVIEIDKPGVGYATYIAVQESKGDIIIRTDADTIFPRTIINTAVEMLANALVAHVGHVYYDGGFIENALAFYYDKYLREPWQTTGHFIAFKRELVEKGVNFNPKLKYDDDWDFGKRVYERFGYKAFSYDYKPSILVSARRIHKTGLVKYVLGQRIR